MFFNAAIRFLPFLLTASQYPAILFPMTALAFSDKINILLSECAELSLGYSFRGRIESAPDGAFQLIQMRDLTDGQEVDSTKAIRSNDQGFSQAHYLQSGDIVFRARGANTTAAFASAVPERTALASPLIRIRVRDETIEPRYLQWFINLPASQAFLGAGSQGTLVRMISIEHLARLPVVLPPLEEQRRVVELAALCAREAGILRRLAEFSELRGRLAISERIFGTHRSEHDD
jgi:hypothetical protein